MAKKPGFTLIVAAFALALHLFAGLSFIRSSAATYDETVHLSSGYSYLHTGRYVMNIMDHPPFAEMLSALPLTLMNLQSFSAHPYFANFMPYHYGDLFLYQNSVSPDRILDTSRVFTFLVWTAVFAWFIWLFASRLEPGNAAAFSVAAFCFMPVFISNDALISTDAGAAAFYFGAFALGWLFTSGGAPGAGRKAGGKLWQRAALAGAVSGLALVSKFSMFIVPPMIAAFWLADNYFQRRMKFMELWGYIALYALSCLLVVALVYKFDLALYWKGLYSTLTRLEEGRSSFVMGIHTLKGVWWYFPAALLVKTPLVILAASAGGVWLIFKKFRRDYLWLVIPPAVFFAAALTAKVQIGYRHIMPVMPFLAVLAGLALARLPGGRKGVWLAAGLLALNAVSVLRVHPYYLAYFNEAAGGPSNGYKLFVDSNLDWGQDIKTAASYLKERGNPPVVLSYFGVARPESYGMRYVPLGVVSNVKFSDSGAQVCSMKEILLAVSATNLQGTYYPDKKTYDWLKERQPAFIAGHSIFIYDLTRDAEGLKKLASLFDREGRNTEAECIYKRAGE